MALFRIFRVLIHNSVHVRVLKNRSGCFADADSHEEKKYQKKKQGEAEKTTVELHAMALAIGSGVCAL